MNWPTSGFCSLPQDWDRNVTSNFAEKDAAKFQIMFKATMEL